MRRLHLRPRWIALAIVVLAGLALGSGFFPQEPLRRIAEGALRRATGPGTRLGRIRVVPALLRGEVEGLVVQGPGYTIDLPRVRVRLGPRALITGTPQIRTLELDGLRLALDLTVKSEAPSRSPLAELGRVRIERLTVRGATLAVRAPGGGSLTVSGLHAHGAVGPGRVEIAAEHALWQDGRSLSLGPATARLDTSGSDASLASFDLDFGRSRVSARGALVRTAVWQPDVEIEGRLDLADMARRLGLGPLSGALALKGRLDLAAGTLHGQARLDGRAGWGDWLVEGLRADLRHDGAKSRTELALSARALGGTVDGTASVDGAQTRGRLAAKGIQLERLPKDAARGMRGPADLDLAWSGPVGGALQVEAHARADARGTRWSARGSAAARGWARTGPASTALEWQAELSGEAPSAARAALRLTARGTVLGPFPPRVIGQLEGRASWDAGRRAELDLSGAVESSGDQLTAHLDARGAAVVAAQAALRGRRLTRLSVHADALDLSGFVPGARGSAVFELEGSGPLEKPSLSLQASARDLGWREARFGGLRANVAGDTRKLELSWELPDLAFHGSGELTLGAAYRLRGRAQLDGTPLGAFAALLLPAGAAPLSGHMSAGIEYDLDPRRPRDARLTVDVAQLDIERQGQSFRAQPFRATLVERRLAVDTLDVSGPGLRLSARGTAGLAPRDAIDLQTQVDLDLATLPIAGGGPSAGGAPEPVSPGLRGQAHAEVAVRGSRERPRLEGSLRLLRVAGRVPGLSELRLDQAEIQLQGDRLVLTGLEAQIGGGTARLAGDVPFAALLPVLRNGALTPAGEARIALQWDGVQADTLGGPVSGQLTIEGGLASLREPRARLELPDTRLHLEGQPFELLATTLSLDRGRLDVPRVTLRGQGGDFVVSGSADLLARTLALAGHGSLDLRALSPLLTETAVGGTADVNLEVDGPFASPRPHGSVRVREGTLRLRRLPQALTGITGGVELTAAGARIDATGELGGGSLRVAGDLAAAGRSFGDAHVTVTGRNVALAYPAGMRSRLDTDLSLTGRPGAFALAGEVVVQRGLYELDVAIEQAVTAARVTGAESALLRGVSLDVRVSLARPLVVRSGLGNLEVVGQLVARGDMQEPLPFGRLQVRPGGRLELQGREFTVSDGALTYSGNWNPEISLHADTRIREAGVGARGGSEQGDEYHVTVTADGTLDEPRLVFSSEPTLSQQAIVSLVATGNTSGPSVDTSAWLVGGQAGSLLADRLTQRVARTFGLDQLTVRPDLVAGETDPSARFTFGKDLGRRLGILYSAGLGGPETRFVQVEGRPGFDFTLKLQRTDAGSYTYGAGQRFHWGDARRRDVVRERSGRLGAVRVEGSGVPGALRAALHLAPGDRASGWRIQEEAERLREWLRGRLYLAAEVAARLEGTTAIFSVAAGPLYGWRVEGFGEAGDLGSAVRDALFEEDALERGRERLLRGLHARGHWRARVDTAVEAAGDRRMLVFRVSSGPRYADVSVRFAGAQALSQRELLAAAGGSARLLEDPRAAIEAVNGAYRARHHLAAKVDTPRVEETPGRLGVVVEVAEGPEARLAAVRFEGTSLDEAELRKVTRLELGAPFADVAVAKAVAGLRALYLSRGFPDVRVRPQLVPEGADLALVLRVTEGERRQIQELTLAGNTRTREGLVRRALGLKIGDPLDPRRLARAEQRLVNLGTFSRVAIVPRPASPSTLDVQLEEGPLFTASYDLRWNQDEKLSALVEGELRNLLGAGLALGARQRLGGDLRETRGWLHLPAILAGGDLTGSVFRTEEDRSSGVTLVQRGFQLQDSLRVRGGFQVYAGYRFRRSTTFAADLDPLPIDVAGIDLSLVQTTRDNLLDPLEGHFLSVNLELDPRWLGSDAPFVKGFAQLAFAHSFANRSLTWASGFQLGLARASGGEPLLFSERFLAGGANSLRGFATNQLGAPDAPGGEAVLIFNQELRYRHRSGLGAAAFYDAGNVFPQARDVSLDLRQALGVGLRWSSPVGLLRLDVGFPVDRLPKEKRYQLFFSLGQAF